MRHRVIRGIYRSSYCSRYKVINLIITGKLVVRVIRSYSFIHFNPLEISSTICTKTT